MLGLLVIQVNGSRSLEAQPLPRELGNRSIFGRQINDMQATEATRILRKEMKNADTDNDGMIDFQEFQGYFQTLARYQQNEARQQRLQGARKTVPAG